MRRWNWIRLAAASFAACAGARADALPAVVCTQIPTGGQGGRLVLRQPGGATRVLTQGFESAADPEVSFDGTRILFAGRRQPGDRWTIFEMNLDGSGVRQITRCTGNCRSPVYQPPIFYLDDPAPVPQIAFVSDEPATFGEHGGGRVTHLYSARLDG